VKFSIHVPLGKTHRGWENKPFVFKKGRKMSQFITLVDSTLSNEYK